MNDHEEVRRREINKKANGVAKNVSCSHSVALRTLSPYCPSVKLSIDEMHLKRRPCIIALDMYFMQRDYIAGLRSIMLPLEKTSLPCFQPGEISKPSNGYTMLTWAEVAQHVNNGPIMEIAFINSNPNDPPRPERYEDLYQNILAEGFTDVLGFITAVDGIVPLSDYMHARHFGGKSRFPPQPPLSIDVTSGVEPKQLCSPKKHQHYQKAVRRTRNLYGNNPETSISHRQNKASSQMVLKAKGLAHICGGSAHGYAEARQEMLAAGIVFPVILKPVSGAGSEFVTLCHNDNEIDAAFAVCKNAMTTQLTDASHMVLQEYIEGQEYVVNTVSYQGQHIVTDVWKSWKYPLDVYSTRLRRAVEDTMQKDYMRHFRGHLPERLHTTAILFDRLEFVHNLADLAADSEERRVVDYTLQCLDALEVRQGCTHCELRVDERVGSAKRGCPVLIELNARVLGDTPRVTDFVGYDQYTLVVYLALCAAALPEDKIGTSASCRSRLPWPPAPRLYRSLISSVTRHVVFLRAEVDSYVCIQGVREIKALPTFKYLTRDTIFDESKYSAKLLHVCMTTDLLTSPGACVMEGTEADIRRDTAYIRRVENKNLSEWETIIDTVCEMESARLNISLHSAKVAGGMYSDINMSGGQASKNSENAVEARRKVAAFFTAMQEPPLFVNSTIVKKLRILGAHHIINGSLKG